jgi:hypothetical protein
LKKSITKTQTSRINPNHHSSPSIDSIPNNGTQKHCHSRCKHLFYPFPSQPRPSLTLASPDKQPGGNVGTAILHELLKPSSSPPPSTLTLITRPTSTYTPPTNATTTTTTIIHKTVDYTSFSSLQSAFTNQDAIVNCVTGSATQYDASHLIITAAVAAGVKFFFANEFVGDIQRLAYTRLPEQFVGAKVRIRAELQELARQGKICWTSLNTGPFFDMCKFFFFLSSFVCVSCVHILFPTWR